MWLQQHSQWLDLLEGLLDEVLARYLRFFVAHDVVDLTRLPTLVHDDPLVHRPLRELRALDHGRDVLVLILVLLVEREREHVLHRAYVQTNQVLVLQEHRTRHLLPKHPTDRVPNFLLLQVCQQLFLPIPYISSLLI
jgi:hypothetical protein